MDTEQVRSLTDALVGELIPPALGEAPDVCRICRDWTDVSPTCVKCRDAEAILGTPAVPVVPISVYVKPSAMRDRLTLYKDLTAEESGAYATEVAALFERFFQEHAGELAARFGPWDAATVVPSKGTHVGPHPLELALRDLPARAVPAIQTLLHSGPHEIGRRAPVPDGFVAEGAAAGRRILLLDDVYTTGATAQSAAHALVAAGARVPAIVVAGRRLNPTAFAAIGTLVDRQRAIAYSFTTPLWEP